MKFYALPKVDGGVAILQCQDKVDPAVEISRWHPSQRALVTGEVHEIDPASLPADRTHRDAWKHNAGKIEIDTLKKAEIDARPQPRTLEQRIAALEAKGTGRA